MTQLKMGALVVTAFAVAMTPLLDVSALANETTEQRIIITYKHQVNDNDITSLHNAGAQPIKKLGIINGVVVTVPSAAATNKLKALQGVANVESDALAFATAPPSKTEPVVTQPAQTTPWGITRSGAPEAWSTSRGAGVKVAVIDTGIDKTHPDLVNNIAGGVNFVQSGRGARVTVDPSAWSDDNGHGTHVSGTIAAVDNTIGVVGVAPQAKVFGVKVLNSAGSGYVSDIISGIDWSVTNNMQVMNMSLSMPTHVQALQGAITAAENAGVISVVAAGNTGDSDALTNNIGYPAKYSNVIAVAATDNTDRIASFSSDGEEVDIAAPGVNIYSTTRGGGYTTLNGTSMATPHVAGVVAAMLAAPVVPQADTNQDGVWSAQEVRAYLLATSNDLGAPGQDVFFGQGIVDAREAVTGL